MGAWPKREKNGAPSRGHDAVSSTDQESAGPLWFCVLLRAGNPSPYTRRRYTVRTRARTHGGVCALLRSGSRSRHATRLFRFAPLRTPRPQTLHPACTSHSARRASSHSRRCWQLAQSRSRGAQLRGSHHPPTHAARPDARALCRSAGRPQKRADVASRFSLRALLSRSGSRPATQLTVAAIPLRRVRSWSSSGSSSNVSSSAASGS